MLIICNGATKSGSTWLVSIVRSVPSIAPLPREYQDPAYQNPSINEKYISKLAGLAFYGEADFYCKQHWSGEAAHFRIARMTDVRLLNIVRDLRDMLVSRYFHDLRLKTFDGSLAQYFSDGTARLQLRAYIRYQRFWHRRENTPVFLASYEALKQAYDPSADALFAFLGVSDEQQRKAFVEKSRKSTDFKQLPVTGPGQFYRKGEVGDFRNHFTPKMEDIVFDCAQRNHYGVVKSQMARQFPMLREWLASTDIGLDRE